MISRVIEAESLDNVRSGMFDGLLVDYVSMIGATHIIRGLRVVTDFEYEFQIDAINRSQLLLRRAICPRKTLRRQSPLHWQRSKNL